MEELLDFAKFGTQVYLGSLSIDLWFVWSYLIKFAQSDLFSDFSFLAFTRPFLSYHVDKHK